MGYSSTEPRKGRDSRTRLQSVMLKTGEGREMRTAEVPSCAAGLPPRGLGIHIHSVILLGWVFQEFTSKPVNFGGTLRCPLHLSILHTETQGGD